MEATSSTPPLCMIDALRFVAAVVPNNDALLAPGRQAISFTQLLAQVETTVGVLNGFGLSHTSRVLILLPNGAEAISTLYSVTCACTAVLLNPETKAEEFEIFLKRSKAEALLIMSGSDTPLRAIAEINRLRIIEVEFSEDNPSGLFTLKGGNYVPPTFTKEDDIAVLIATSGTTGLPKLIPMRHKPVFEIIQAMPFRDVLAATPETPKCFVNMLPLFHMYGFSNLTSSLTFGLTIIATRGFNVDDFYRYLDTYRPTVFLALPSMLKAIVEAAPHYGDVLSRSSLEIISSTSAPLSPEIAAEAQRLFGASLVISYGMSEIGTVTWTSSMFARYYKPGSVGQPIVEVAIRGENGEDLPAGAIGEVVARKSAAFPGYEGDPAASAAPVEDEWFHTGDLGYLDEDNFLFLTGRLKEIINRGGEKISPEEVERAFLQHPSVAEAAVFGVPHLALGEDLAAAVVVRDPSLTSKALRTFLAGRLAPVKVPGTIQIVDEIPETPTGKKKRTALPSVLELASPTRERTVGRGPLAPAITAPRTAIERQLLTIWSQTLVISDVSIYDDFFEALGGTSLQAAQIVIAVGKAFSLTLPVSSLLEAPTIAEMADLLGRLDTSVVLSSAVPIQPFGHKIPLFCVPGLAGQVVSFRALSLHLGIDQPLYGLQTPGSDGVTLPFTRIEALADHLVQTVKRIQKDGPYLIVGKSFGGVVALEMAHILMRRGEKVAMLAILDTPLGESTAFDSPKLNPAQGLFRRIDRHRSALTGMSFEERAQYIGVRLGKLWRNQTQSRTEELLPGVKAIRAANLEAMRAYHPKPYDYPIIYFSARQSRRPDHSAAFEDAWQRLARGGLEICDVPGDHGSMAQEPNVQILAEKLRFYIDRAQEHAGEASRERENT